MSVTCIAKVKNEKGIHARPSSEIATTALQYNSDIVITYDDRKADAKDVLQLIMLELFEGTVVSIIANGDDELEALEAIRGLIEKEYNFD